MAPTEHQPAWDHEEIAEELSSSPVSRVHAAYGEGARFPLGGDEYQPQADLEIYPQTGVVRYTSESIQVTLFQQYEPPHLTANGLLFLGSSETELRSVLISPQGTVNIFTSINGPLTLEQESLIAERSQEPLPAPAERPKALTPEGTPSIPEGSNGRLNVLGTASGDAVFTTSARGIPIARFTLEVETEDGPQSHTVVAFNDVAETLRGYFGKGELLRVVGYKHLRHVERNGEQVPIEEIYAATVRKPRTPVDPE